MGLKVSGITVELFVNARIFSKIRPFNNTPQKSETKLRDSE